MAALVLTPARVCVVRTQTLKINSGWFYKAERGVFSGVFGCMISFGYYLALVVGGLMLGNIDLCVV